MPKAGKIYLISGNEDLKILRGKMDGWEATEKYQDGDYEITLLEDIWDLALGKDHVSGVYSYDYVTMNRHRGKILHTPATQDCPFRIGVNDGKLWLLVSTNKTIANRAAVRIGEICNIDVREAHIYSREMNHYMKANQDAKVILLDELDLPGVNKNTLYGEELVQTSLFNELIGRGIPKWIVLRSALSGYTVGVGGDSSVTIFNTVNALEYTGFIEDEILPLVFRKVKAPEQQNL